jgi:preprotein translocase subunit Sec63
MVQKIHPRGLIWVPSFPLHVGRSAEKKWQQFRPYIKKSMNNDTVSKTFGSILNELRLDYIVQSAGCFSNSCDKFR